MLLHALIVLFFAFFASLTVNAQSLVASNNSLKLGTVNFETHTPSLDAHQHFELGLIYLHNFMYSLALREFKLAESADPTFALSYWGQAMAYKWSLWSYVNHEKGT
jgi:Tfp pilus assembly protein PilF